MQLPDKVSITGKPSFFHLTPFLVFILLYAFISFVFSTSSEELRTNFPIASVLFAAIYALFTFPKSIPFNKRIELFVDGAANPIIIYMCFIFIFSSIFSHMLSLTGGVSAAVSLGLSYIPPFYILPGLFFVVSLFALTIGSSMGSIAAFMPIAAALAIKLGVNPGLMAATVVSGSMLGDNLSTISDTTIASTKTIGCSMSDKFKANFLLVLPAFLISLALLAYMGQGNSQIGLVELTKTSFSLVDFIKMVPYFIVLALAVWGLDVLGVLVSGCILAAIIGCYFNEFTIVQALSFFFEGFYIQKGMVKILVFVFLISGLANLIEHNGGIAYILEKCQPKVTGKRSAEFIISIIVFFITAAVANNTISILISAPIAKKIGQKAKLPKSRVASLLDIFACITKGAIPYGGQLLMASAMIGISSLDIMPYLYYQFAIFFIAVLSILFQWPSHSK